MAQVYDNTINDDVDWGGDATHTGGLPCSGRVVQAYIKEGVIAGKTANSQRGGYMHFDTTSLTIYLFRDQSHYEAWDLSAESNPPLSSVSLSSILTNSVTRVAVTNTTQGGTSLNYSTSDTTMPISFTLIGQSKSLSDTNWSPVGDAVTYTISVDVGSTGTYRQVKTATVSPTGTTPASVTEDLKSYLGSTAGYHLVRINATTTLGWTGSLTYNIYCTSMALAPSAFAWHLPFIQSNSNFGIGGFIISGSIEKTLKVKVTGTSGNNYSHTYTESLGTRTYPSTAPLTNWKPSGGWDSTMFTGNSYGSGVYNFEIWLESGNVQSAHLSYNIICIKTNEVGSAKFVCVNECESSVSNYVTNTMFGYALYYGESETSDTVTILSKWKERTDVSYTTNVKPAETFSSVLTQSKQFYTTDININTPSLDAMVQTTVTHGNTQTITYDLDNSASYPCVSSSNFIFEMKPANRSNSESSSNRQKIVNEAPYPLASSYNATWTSSMAWADGVDGWTTDDAGRKCLRLPAGTKSVISSFQPFGRLSGGTKNALTIEMTYKIANAADSTEAAINIGTTFTPTGQSTATFRGLEAYPTQLLLHTNADSYHGASDDRQCVYYEEDKTVHVLISIAKGNTFTYNNQTHHYNLATIYVNGVQNCMFTFGDNDNFGEGTITLGSSSADLYVYNMRVYDEAVSYADAMTNYISSLETTTAKINANNREQTDNAEGEMSFERAYQNYNVMVVEMTNGLLPRADQTDGGLSNVEFYFHDHPECNIRIENVETTGQGTTSMNYYLWNLRFRIDKWPDGIPYESGYETEDHKYTKYRPVCTWDTTNNQFGEPQDAKKVAFGYEGFPDIMRITAKKNFASSMQSHKIGATRAFNDLHNAVVGNNEVQALQVAANKPKSTVAVYQYPFYAFERNGGQYTFIGLYTAGPDKGDKPTFGYDYNNDVKGSLITLEGMNHNMILANFRYPWLDPNSSSAAETDATCTVFYNYRNKNESLNVKADNGQSEPSWECGNCEGLDTDKEGSAQTVYERLRTRFKPAYDVAYRNSTLIMPLSMCPAAYNTIAKINADVEGFRNSVDSDGYTYDRYEIYDDSSYSFPLYYYNHQSKFYVNVKTDGNANFSLTAQCGITTTNPTVVINGVSKSWVSATVAEKLAYFKQRRIYYFLNGNPNEGYTHNAASTYWDINDSIFHYTFLFVIGATDNFAKNTYPYKMLSGKWRWRQDDLDTIFDIDNNGNARKEYSIEPLDWIEESKETRVFNGEDSAFWTLIREAYPNEIKTMGKSILTAMATLGTPHTTSSNTIDKIMAFYEHYFWGNAQDYFTKRAYNEDSRIGYQVAYPMYIAGWPFGNVNPLSQALGDHFSAERRWVYYRTIYLMSKFQQGAFDTKENDGIGIISFRTNSPISVTLTPAMDIYPSVRKSDAASYSTSPERIKYGEKVGNVQKTFTATDLGGGDSNLYIMAADCYSSIGDLSGKAIGSYPMVVAGKRLTSLILGNQTAGSVSNAMTGLTLGNNPSLVTLDCRNLSGLIGSVNMTQCPRIEAAYFDGSKITSVSIKHGSKIRTLSIPQTLQSLDLTNLGSLTNPTIPSGMTGMVKCVIDGCVNVKAMTALYNIWNSARTNLKNVRVVFTSETSVPAAVVNQMLYQMAKNPSVYKGVDANGNNTQGKPVFVGTISIATGQAIVQSYLTTVNNYFQSGGLIITTTGTVDAIPIYDPNVLAIITNPNLGWDINNDGAISSAEALVVTVIPKNAFRSNTEIQYFNELGQYFTRVTEIAGGESSSDKGAFGSCTQLREIQVPDGLTTIGAYAFDGCQYLRSIRYEGDSSVYNTESSAGFINLPLSVVTIGEKAFRDCNAIRTVESLGSVTVIPNGCFYDCDYLKAVTLPETLTSIGAEAFYNCENLKKFTPLAFTPPSTSNLNSFNGIGLNGVVFCPAGSLSLYQASETWFKADTAGNLAAKGWSLVENYATDGRIYVYYNVTDTSNATKIGGTGMSGTNFSKMELYSNGSWTQITIGNTYTFSTTGTHVIRFTPSTATSAPLAPNMFYNATGNVASKVILPNGFTILGATMAGTSSGNCAATELVFPPSIVDIRSNNSFESLQKLYIFDLRAYLSFTNVASHPLGGSQTHHIYLNGEEITSLEIPSGVTQIPQNAFNRCSSITSVTIPSTVTSIGDNAFANLSSLPSILLNEGITSLGDYCLSGCTGLTELTIPSTVTALGRGFISNDSNIVTIYCKPTTPPSVNTAIGWGGYSLTKLATIYVPAASLTNYQNASGWSGVASKLVGYNF